MQNGDGQPRGKLIPAKLIGNQIEFQGNFKKPSAINNQFNTKIEKIT